jgi:hypothetical protein
MAASIQDGVESPFLYSKIDWNATYRTIFSLFFMQFGVNFFFNEIKYGGFFQNGARNGKKGFLQPNRQFSTNFKNSF